MSMWIRDPKSVSKADLVKVIERLQVLMYGEDDAQGFLVWNLDKEVNGSDLVELTGRILAEFDLAPVHGPREWIPKSRRRG